MKKSLGIAKVFLLPMIFFILIVDKQYEKEGGRMICLSSIYMEEIFMKASMQKKEKLDQKELASFLKTTPEKRFLGLIRTGIQIL